MIEFKNVTKILNGTKVLDNLSLRIERGETFVIIGRSGTGKTVTLKHIAGLLEPESGVVLVDGQQMNGSSKRQKDSLREKIGFVFQSGALINWMTVEENIALPLVEHKVLPRMRLKKLLKKNRYKK